MEHSHSSKPNAPGEPLKHNEQTTNTEGSETSSESLPSKPLKLKGRYTPKAAPAAGAGQPNGGYMPNLHSAPGQAPYAASDNINHPNQPGYEPYTEQGEKLKHSGLGISSFILAILGLLATIIGFIVVFTSIFDLNEENILLLQDPAYIESIINGSTIPSFFISILIGGLLMMSTAVISFIGFILGCISLFNKRRRKVFGILGTIFNGLFCFGGFFFFLLSFLSAFSV